ncbi:MAG: Crp/Fnr family transcriptional regulator [Croceibacterium sp.]
MALFVERLLLRSALSEAQQAAVLSLPGRIQKVPPSHEIILPGQHTDHSCLIVSGLGARFDMMADGRRQIVAFHVPGDMCDLHSVPAPTSGWGLEALSGATLLFIPHAALREMAQDPGIAMAFWRDTVTDGSILAKWAANLGRKQAVPRLAHLFCEIGIRMEQVGLGSRTDYRLPATQAQLADALGLTSVHLNRTLKSLRERGVAFSGKAVRIEDWDSVTRLAEFDPAHLLLPRRAD